MKIARILIIILVTTVISGIWFLGGDKHKGKGSDFKMGIGSDDGMALVSISWERRMVNILLVDKDREVWIPEGLGWYKSGKVKKLLLLENKWNLFEKLLFYNFGFIADRAIELDRVNDRISDRVLIKEMGLINWIKFKLNSNQMISKEEKVDAETTEEMIDEIMIRDFSDSSLVTDETRIRVINQTEEDGLAGFIGNRLERAGMSVVGIENARGENIKACLWTYQKKPGEIISADIMRRMLGCEEKEDKNLNESEWELYLGEDWAKMIKYSSYVRSF